VRIAGARHVAIEFASVGGHIAAVHATADRNIADHVDRRTDLQFPRRMSGDHASFDGHGVRIGVAEYDVALDGEVAGHGDRRIDPQLAAAVTGEYAPRDGHGVRVVIPENDVAKHLVAAGVCDEVLVQVAYAIGVAQPVGFYVNTYGTSKVKMSDGVIAKTMSELPEFDMRPYFIEKRFKLRTPIYSETASYGHMGRESKMVEKTFSSAGRTKTMKVKLFPWEDLNALGVVKKAFKL